MKKVSLSCKLSFLGRFSFFEPREHLKFLRWKSLEKKWDYEMYLNILVFFSSKTTVKEKMIIDSGEERSKNYHHMFFPHNHQLICDFFSISYPRFLRNVPWMRNRVKCGVLCKMWKFHFCVIDQSSFFSFFSDDFFIYTQCFLKEKSIFHWGPKGTFGSPVLVYASYDLSGGN